MKRALSIIIWILFFVPAVYLAFNWSLLPDKIPMQYGFDGEVNRYGSRNELVVLVGILTIVNIGVYLLLCNVHKIDPKRYASANRDRMIRLATIVSVFITAILCFIVLSSVNQSVKPRVEIILAAIGILFCFLGNYMHNIKPNYFAGIRLPWTLENEENWRLTHILAGKLWFAGGLVIAIIALALPAKMAFIIFFIVLATLVLVPAVYSYKLYRRSSKK